MAITGTNHGLSVLTNAAAEERLQWPFKDSAGAPAIFSLSNTFNDATSGAKYAHPSGHEGIDFACGAGTEVCALYDGLVVKIQDRDSAPYGQFVTLHFGTDPAANSGFLHTYAHWAAGAGAGVQLAAPVSKGPLLGGSGTSPLTGTAPGTTPS